MDRDYGTRHETVPEPNGLRRSPVTYLPRTGRLGLSAGDPDLEMILDRTAARHIKADR